MLNGLTGGYFSKGTQNTANQRKTERPPVTTSDPNTDNSSSSFDLPSPADPFAAGFATPDVSP